MVGVAGKSRACYDCKRRRVKCDFNKPSCSRCDKAKRPCRGYDKATVFVNRTLTEPRTNALEAILEANALQQEANVTDTWTCNIRQIFQDLRNSLNDSSMTPREFRRNAFQILKVLYLPHDVEATETEATNAYSWVHAACQLSLPSHILDLSLLTFCAIQIHVVEPRSDSLDIALQLYSETLPELVRVLADVDERSKDGTLAAIVVLSTCELFVLPTDGSWRAHAQGISELLRHRTGLSFCNNKSNIWLKLCSRMRVICIIIGLSKHQSLLLNTPTWRQLMHVPSSSERYESLMDLAAQLPPLLEDVDAAIATTQADHSALLQSLLAIVHGLEHWQITYPRTPNQPLYWAVPSKLHNPSDAAHASALFPFALEFESLDVAIPFTFSTAVMLQCLAAALRLPNPTSNHRHRATLLARWLAQSLEYCFRSEMGTVSAQTTCHPLWVIGSYFHQMDMQREREWCRRAKDMHGPGLRGKVELMWLGESGVWRG